MDLYKADLHIHTVLSPCGSLDMSPGKIIAAASDQKIDIIGITDHNSTKHCNLVKQLGERKGIYVLMGAEVTTREEIHCLVFFENVDLLDEFQQYLYDYLPFVKNDPDYFGYQVVVDEDEQILEEISSLLIVGIDQSIDEVQNKVRQLNGIFIPAHIDRPRNSVFSQLGFMPDNIIPDAIEINGPSKKEDFLIKYPEYKKYSLIKNSDAHSLSQIGQRYSGFRLNHISFREIGLALNNELGREVVML
jgi:PHP family Zn ribbon phosphoesterase